MAFDRWTILRIFEVLFAASCLICKRVTDDEARRLFLYLRKLSREWSLLNNVTWDRYGAAVADTTYGGYVIITSVLLIGKLSNELPTHRRITERFLLGVGAILFIVLGGLEFAALDSVPPDLIDNAAVLGSLSLFTALLFLIDLAAPKAKLPTKDETQSKQHKTENIQLTVRKEESAPAQEVHLEMDALERRKLEAYEEQKRIDRGQSTNSYLPRIVGQNGFNKSAQNGYKKMLDRPKRFDIYGTDVIDFNQKGTEKEFERHSPVWSGIRKGQYGRYDIIPPKLMYNRKVELFDLHEDSKPSGPSDPGYVEHTVRTWGEKNQKTPRHSPTEV